MQDGNPCQAGGAEFDNVIIWTKKPPFFHHSPLEVHGAPSLALDYAKTQESNPLFIGLCVCVTVGGLAFGDHPSFGEK